MKRNFINLKLIIITLIFIIGKLNSNAQISKISDSTVFNFKPAIQNWTVPQNVHKIKVIAWGAQGGSDYGGKGGQVQCEMDVTPGEQLLIRTGGQGTGPAGGYNGGGDGCGKGTGGGGATDIRIGDDGLNARVLVAGGGGGTGYGGKAGAGGGLIGGEGVYDTTSYHIAKGGTQTDGGAAARAYLSAPGKLGVGGNGLDNRGVCSNGAMGGGGGGYYGGGSSGAGGAGGGSSFTNNRSHSVIHTQGVREGNGKVVIYW
jgi:Glycine rich protein